MDSSAKIAEIFARHRSAAVLLHRPYPPFASAATQSRFGGLPALPDAIEWPRMKDGTPLHFLAQIDCSALPVRGVLPDRGLLFFFGRDDDEQIWGEDYVGDQAWRVIHAPGAVGDDPARPAPPDLMPIGGSYPRPNWRPLLLEGETGPNVHVEWPIELRAMDTWPDAAALTDEDFGAGSGEGWRSRLLALVNKEKQAQQQEADRAQLWDAYQDQLDVKRADAFYAASGFARPRPKTGEPYFRNTQLAMRILQEDSGSHAWPDRWIHVGFFCRALRAGLERPTARKNIEDAEARIAAAAKWISIADASDPAAPVPAAERDTFRRWATSMQRGEAKVALDYAVADWMLEAAKAAIRSFAHDPRKAALITPTLYDVMAPHFQGDSAWGIQYSQMLGHAPSSQQARETDDPTVCLLNLASDAGLGWMFGDVGEATFWIAPDALAQRDFSKAWATLEGH
ncbi:MULTISPECIES: DUF1963 domain-containing protein [unclassified Sphingopyxis]|uniref:DUF1963 domain-containing protein n=1 Tax=unclassified Sphingopyxis TaxID=2614943 RepID=UPI002862E714|nr:MULTISPECIES: DUF1963 domain-containing protein [unclassified Sphingopyxis]MDR6832194.1 hypothetical protein [Sphingopyxis sp. BE122]MDR7227937.1 hypothetical protein [Sphingopyxis sp. BE259]